MDRNEALRLLRGGPDGIRHFNQTRPTSLPDLSKAHLSEAKLFDANLSDAVLRGAKLRRTELYRADLRGTDLRGVDLRAAKLSVSNLRRAQLNKADLRTALMRWCDLRGAVLGEAKLDKADLTGANLIWSDLYGAQLNETILSKADLRWARFGDTSVACALDETRGLNEVKHWGPSHLSLQAILGFKGQVPQTFLRGCGLANWEIKVARSYDPHITADENARLQAKIPRRPQYTGRFIGGIFICYCQQDVVFVDQLEKSLQDVHVPVWRDEHKETDDPIQRCAVDAARPKDVVLLVMSQNAIHGDWAKALMRRQHEKEQEHRNTGREQPARLSPIVLDDAWKVTAKDSNSTIQRDVFFKTHLFNFSHWRDDRVFESTFEQLLCDLRIDTKPADSDQEPIL